MFDAHGESFGIRVLADCEDELYEDPYADLVRSTLKQFVENETPIIATKRRVTSGQVERALNPDKPFTNASVPLLDRAVHFGLTA